MGKTEKEIKYVCNVLRLCDYKTVFPYQFFRDLKNTEEFLHIIKNINNREFVRSDVKFPEAEESWIGKIKRKFLNGFYRKKRICKCGNEVNAKGVSYGILWNHYHSFKCKECLREVDKRNFGYKVQPNNKNNAG